MKALLRPAFAVITRFSLAFNFALVGMLLAIPFLISIALLFLSPGKTELGYRRRKSRCR